VRGADALEELLTRLRARSQPGLQAAPHPSLA
jgi:hypothetical protein